MHRITILLVFILIGIQSYSQNFKIGILTDKLDGRSAPLLNQLKAEIKAVVGEDATINFGKMSCSTSQKFVFPRKADI